MRVATGNSGEDVHLGFFEVCLRQHALTKYLTQVRTVNSVTEKSYILSVRF